MCICNIILIYLYICVCTLHYITLLFSHITDSDILQTGLQGKPKRNATNVKNMFPFNSFNHRCTLVLIRNLKILLILLIPIKVALLLKMQLVPDELINLYERIHSHVGQQHPVVDH